MRKLTPKQERFVAEYLIDLNATQAAIRAGYSPRSAQMQGSRLLLNAMVSEAIQNGRKRVVDKIEFDAVAVMRNWVEIATADPNELIQYRRGACPSCWEASEPAADGAANPACPTCRGEGRGSVFVHDTRKLKGAAKRLYAGVQLGKDGLKVLLRDQDAALVNIARHLGMFKEDNKRDLNVSIASLIEGSFGKKDGD